MWSTGGKNESVLSYLTMTSRHQNKREIRIRLEKKHSDKYTGPQYSLWATFIRMGRHNDYEQPPAIPLITGEQKGEPKTDVTQTLAGAATAITNALTSQSKCSSPSTSKNSGNALSPNNRANLRRKHLEDLRMLSQLRDDGVLTNEEFQQNQCIMSGLKKTQLEKETVLQVYTLHALSTTYNLPL